MARHWHSFLRVQQLHWRAQDQPGCMGAVSVLAERGTHSCPAAGLHLPNHGNLLPWPWPDAHVCGSCHDVHLIAVQPRPVLHMQSMVSFDAKYAIIDHQFTHVGSL